MYRIIVWNSCIENSNAFIVLIKNVCADNFTGSTRTRDKLSKIFVKPAAYNPSTADISKCPWIKGGTSLRETWWGRLAKTKHLIRLKL